MTLPINRFNALCDTKAFMLALRDDEALPEQVRQRALSLLKHSPTDGELRRLAELAPDLLSTKLSGG